MGRGNGSNPQVSASASVAVTSEFHLFSAIGSSDRLPDEEVQMKNDQFTRNRHLSVGVVARVHVRLFCMVTAAFLMLGYGDGLSPSA